MNKTSRFQCLFSLLLVCNLALAAEFDSHYEQGDQISTDVFVADRNGSQVNLLTLLGDGESGINVLFIFGGGDMGAGMPGHLWCQDSFEDTQILRTLYGKYQDRGVNFIAVASAPVYHTQMLGHPAGVFLTDAEDSENFKTAEQAFVESTLASLDSGILPFEPFFDARFRLMFNRSEEVVPRPEYGEIYSWQGTFRAEDEKQFYGVPSFWIINDEGEILTPPFRGNIYHPHGSDVTINYTFRELDMALEGLL